MWDRYVINPAGGISFGADITYERTRATRASGLEFPTRAGETGIVQNLGFGPNFIYSPVPELPTYMMMFTGIILIAAIKRKKIYA